MVFRVFSPMFFFDRKGIYMNIRLANQNDIQHILYLMHEAKAFLASQNIDQWQNEYPSKTDILQDLEQKMVMWYVMIQKLWDMCVSLLMRSIVITK